MSALRAHWKLVVAGAAAVAVAAVAVVVSTAGSSSDSSETAGSNEQAALDFARCMRDNRVPSFPDPVAQPDGSFKLQRPPGVPTSVLDDALQSCQAEAQALGISSGSDEPDPAVQDKLLELSRCMRENGLPEFPDPKPGSDVMTGLHGLFENFDLDSPRVAKAVQSCRSIVNELLAPVHGGS
jgi:hypothetical protein